MPFNHDSSSGSPLPTACMLVISISVTSFTASPVTVISLVDGLYVTVTSHVSVTSNVILLPVASPIQFCSPLAVFSANGTWADSWGGAEENFTPESGVAFDAVYNGQNLTVNVPYALADVTLRIDLSNFNYATKTGAVATVTVTDAVPKTYIGDVNGDGKIDANDVTTLQMFIAKYADVTVNEAVADVDGNGKINVLDVTAIQKYVAGGFDGTGNAGKVLENIA